MRSGRALVTPGFGILLLVLTAHPVTGQATPGRVAGYQVGAFVDETHAQAVQKKLGESDLFGEVRRKTVKGILYWVVLVPVSDIPFENIRQKLLDAGYLVSDIPKSEWDPLAKS